MGASTRATPIRRAGWIAAIVGGLAGIACGVSPDTRTAPVLSPSVTVAATASDGSAGALDPGGARFARTQAANASHPSATGEAMTVTRPAAGPIAAADPASSAPPPVLRLATPSPANESAATGGWQRAAVTAPARTVAARPAARPAAQAAPQATPQAAVYSGVATYYGWDFQGLPTASGPPFDMNDPTITASNLWPFGTRLRVWRVSGGPWDATLSSEERSVYFGHSIIVTVVDRGLFVHALDLSYAAFAQLGRVGEGVIAVYIQPVP